MPTREEIERWLTNNVWGKTVDEYPLKELILAALAHFAPPSRIAGMTVEEIAAEIGKDPNRAAAVRGCWTAEHAARVVHRLAREPAVDRDAEAKQILSIGWPHLKWEEATHAIIEGCRRLAAQKEKRDGT